MSRSDGASELRMEGISKAFAGVPALQDVDFSLRGGQIHALLGANGAGKSTLMKFLSGAYEADEGTLAIDGRPVTLRSPADAKRAGIHCVYQEVDLSLVPHLTVAENILLDRFASSSGRRWIRLGALCRNAEAALKRIGLKLPVRKRVRACAYIASGVLAAVGGILFAARIGSGQIDAGAPYLMESVAAVFVGYSVFAAGRPNIIGTFFGAMLMGVMVNGLTMLNVQYYTNDIIKGIVLVLALGVTFVHLARKKA